MKAIILFMLALYAPLSFAQTATAPTAPQTATAPKQGDAALPTHVTLKTNFGDIVIALNQTQAPISVQNFVAYIKAGFYDDTIFHRVINGFIIQGGGFTPSMTQKATQPAIKNEAKNGLSNVRGSIAMARTSKIHSATSQFFINIRNNSFLDHGVRDYGYAVFGKVVKGMNVVDQIARQKTKRDKPIKPVVILSTELTSTSKVTTIPKASPTTRANQVQAAAR